MTPRQKKKLTIALALFALVAAGAIAFGYHAEAGAQVRRCVAFFRDQGAWPFFLAMAVLPAVGFPVAAFNVVTGAAFGATLGIPGAITCGALAIAANLSGCYWIAAGAMRPVIERGLKRLGYAVPQFPATSAWEIILIVRIIPGPPLFLQNYLLGVMRVPFGIYLLVSILVQLAFLTATVTAGDALMRGDWRALVIAGILFVAVGAVMHRLRLRLAAARKARPAAASARHDSPG